MSIPLVPKRRMGRECHRVPKEQVGGFILIEAAGMDEALEIAAGILLAKLGGIEVRPIMHIEA
jgi:hypothetical protein